MSTFFLGANSYNGFYSLYEAYFRTGEAERLFVIKGGPGGGKSGFMRRIGRAAEKRGLEVIQILCSGDPDSLDGLHIPQLGLMFADGTAPHVLEPEYVGQHGAYIDLSRFCSMQAQDIPRLTAQYKEHYRRAYCWLGAAGSAYKSIALPPESLAAAERRAAGVINRELKRRGHDGGSVKKMFTEAFTCQGLVSLPGTRSELCARLISLDNEYGAAAYMLRILCRAAVGRGYDVILCPSPLDPDRPEHLLIPELSLGFVSGRGGRRIHLDRIVAENSGEEELSELKSALSLHSRLLEKAHEQLALAKAAHDRLEAAVNPHVDFDGVYALADSYIQNLEIDRA